MKIDEVFHERVEKDLIELRKESFDQEWEWKLKEEKKRLISNLEKLWEKKSSKLNHKYLVLKLTQEKLKLSSTLF